MVLSPIPSGTSQVVVIDSAMYSAQHQKVLKDNMTTTRSKVETELKLNFH